MSLVALIEKARKAGVTLRLVDGKVKAIGQRAAVAEVVEELRPFRAAIIDHLSAVNDPEPSPDPTAWRELAQAYHLHHFTCPTCIAAGRGSQYGLRCGVGASLWAIYQNQIN